MWYTRKMHNTDLCHTGLHSCAFLAVQRDWCAVRARPFCVVVCAYGTVETGRATPYDNKKCSPTFPPVFTVGPLGIPPRREWIVVLNLELPPVRQRGNNTQHGNQQHAYGARKTSPWKVDTRFNGTE